MKLQLLGWIFIFMGFSAASCVNADEFLIEKELVKQKLIDADSAKFQNLSRVVNSKNEDAVCGEVNSRNRMGGYAGFSNFVVLESKFVIFEGTGILDNAYKLSGCAGPDVELITRLSDEADFNCSVLWNMITNTTIMGESVSSAVDSAITATINRAKGNGVTLTDIQLANFKEEFYKSLNTTLANKEFVEAIKKSPDYQGRIFNKSCAAQTLQILRSQVGV
ncbi:hypothetical protein [Shewanella sp.]|uniref:hypothetical protein n=1 Tax=Shewanella sp. TaxID=50422 RepID=UPI004048C6CB